MSKLNSVQIVCCLLLCVAAGFLAVDLFAALNAQPCPAGSGCYPWGAEGPFAGRWSYASKANYIVSDAVQLGLVAFAAVTLVWKTVAGRGVSSVQRIAMALALFAAAMLLLI